MRVSQVLGVDTLREIVNVLANRLHARDNFAPDGDSGQILTSNGDKQPPSWQDIPSGITGGMGAKGDTGTVGAAGATGATGAMGPAGPMMPTFIADGDTFTIPADMQGLYAMTIDVEGTLDVEGYLILVD